MNIAVRDGKFDVVIAAGPRVENWPSIGVRTLSTLCADMGLTAAQFGGENVTVRGVIPLPGTGGLILVEDVQKRIHRIHARAIIRLTANPALPDPFPGWRSQGLIPLATAERLSRESLIKWDPSTVILGTGNRALRFGTYLLDSGVPEVFCVESFAQWGAKRFAGWEVERRRFEMTGGKLIEAKPLQLIPKPPLLWQLRLQDSQGIRVLDVGRVVSAGPFSDHQRVREYPPGSLLFEFDQTAANTEREDVEGWTLEEERGKWLVGKIVKTLVSELGSKKEELDPIFKKARLRLKNYLKHREEPFTPSYQGKWIHGEDSIKIRSFRGVPQSVHLIRPIASVECFEEIPCNLCQTVCPTSAIQIGKVPRNKNQILDEAACTACGLCVNACPSSTITLIREKENEPTSTLSVSWRGPKLWAEGEFAILLNRRGESLGSGRVTAVLTQTHYENQQLVQVELPTHLLWEARGIKRGRPPTTYDEAYLSSVHQSSMAPEKVEISLNGERRLVRNRVPISIALFETGHARPEDVLFCKDGSCGLCQISVDGVNKPACQTRIHRGMSIKAEGPTSPSLPGDQALCACLEATREQVIARLRQGNLRSPEAVLSVTRVGEGKCHGSLCMEAFKRVLQEEGLSVERWIDWRFPWTDWTLST